jgi:hypothetical protein
MWKGGNRETVKPNDFLFLPTADGHPLVLQERQSVKPQIALSIEKHPARPVSVHVVTIGAEIHRPSCAASAGHGGDSGPWSCSAVLARPTRSISDGGSRAADRPRGSISYNPRPVRRLETDQCIFFLVAWWICRFLYSAIYKNQNQSCCTQIWSQHRTSKVGPDYVRIRKS